MKKKFKKLRIMCLLEGISLIILVGVAVPIKYIYREPFLVKIIGPIHGLFFLLFILNLISIRAEQKTEIKSITWKLLLASLIPFGNFYIDRKILSKISYK